VTAFLKTSEKYGATATSLWVWQFASRGQWTALSKHRALFE
jgi:hypothetical protein